MVVGCLSTLDLHRVRIFLSSFSSDCHLFSRRVIRIESSSRVSRRSDRNAPILRSSRPRDWAFVPRVVERKDAGKTVEQFLENHAPSYFHRAKKLIERPTESGVDGRTCSLPPSARSAPRFERQSILSPPLYPRRKKEKGLGPNRNRRERERTKIPPRDENGACWTVGKMTGRVYNSTRTDGRWFVLSSGRTLGCRQKNYYA